MSGTARLAELRVVDRVCREQRDMLWMMLVVAGQYTLLPEIYEVFGQESLIRFLEIFGGTTIVVPPREAIYETARAIDIFTRVYNTGHRSTTITRLAEEYDISEEMVTSIFKETADTMHALSDLKQVLRGEETGDG